jgi:putative tricarboxylic transport membrane protein
LVFSTVALYGMRQLAFDLVVLWMTGVAGLVMRRLSFPVAPVIVGIILGSVAEKQLRSALSLGEGKWDIFVERPISLVLLCAVVVVTLPRLLTWYNMRKATTISRYA